MSFTLSITGESNDWMINNGGASLLVDLLRESGMREKSLKAFEGATYFNGIELNMQVADDVELSRSVIEALSQAVRIACDQYAENIAPQSMEERFEAFFLEDHGLSVEEAIQLFRDRGIAPFLTLELIFVSEPLSTISFDFECFGEDYFDQHGFSFDIAEEKIEMVTPRLLMREGSYPASRHGNPAE